MNTELIESGAEQAVAEAGDKADELLAQLPTAITEDRHVVFVNRLMTETNSQIKEFETRRKAITVPLDTAKKSVMEMFRDPLDRLEAIKARGKRLLIDYTRRQDEIRRQKEAALRAEQEAEAARLREEAKESAKTGGIAAKVEAEEKMAAADVVAHREIVIAPPPKIDKRMVQVSYYAEVVSAAEVPATYMIPDQKALDALARQNKGLNPPPGVVFHEKA